MNNKKTMIGLVAGIGMMLVLNIFPIILSKASSNCWWGYASVETSWWPPSNNMTSKLCDCTEVKYKSDGNNTKCTWVTPY